MKNFCEKFISLPHTIRGRELNLLEEFSKFRKIVAKYELRNKLVFLSHSKAENFAIQFLYLIDCGAVPVGISFELSPILKEDLERRFPYSYWLQEDCFSFVEQKSDPKMDIEMDQKTEQKARQNLKAEQKAEQKVKPLFVSKLEDIIKPASFEEKEQWSEGEDGIQGTQRELAEGEHGSVQGTPHQYACLSSGTTGVPKLIRLSVEGALKNATAHALSFDLQRHHRIIQSLPIYHSFGIVSYIWTSIVCNIPLDFHSQLIGLRSLRHLPFENLVLYTSPSQARFILKDSHSNPYGLKILSIGGGSIDTINLLELRNKFPFVNLFVSYGLTEAGPRVSTGKIELSWTPTSEVGTFIGKALPGLSLGIYGKNNQIEKQGKGLLCIQSPSLLINPKSDEMIYKTWLKTRDNVLINEDGNIWFLSRSEDIIKCGGVSIYPSDIEKLAFSFPGVSDAIVLKEKDPFYEEVPILYIEANDIELAKLEDFLAEHLAPSQRPRSLFIVPKFPRQSLNKIDRRALRELFLNKINKISEISEMSEKSN